MSDFSDSIAFSDLTLTSKLILLLGWLIKSTILFCIFFALVVLKQKMIVDGNSLSDIALGIAFVVVAYSMIFLIFYIITEHIIKNMIVGMIISIIGAVLAIIFPPLGIIIAIIGIISMISKIISVIKMIPMLLLGILFAALLFADILIIEFNLYDLFDFMYGTTKISIFGLNFTFSKIMLGYISLSALISLVLAFKYSLKNAMMRQVVIFMSIPITALIVWLAHTLISNAFYQPSEVQQMGIHEKKLSFVPSYYRSDGTLVSSYFRLIKCK